MKIRIINKSRHKLPEYASDNSAGMDLRANLDEDIVLEPKKRVLVNTDSGSVGFGRTGKH
jgi:dUTP pyrophosphatase